jgi:hypothetical protein
MNATATRQVGVQLSLPVPTGQPQTLTTKGQAYEILRFKGKGPTLAQTIATAESTKGKQMLTLKEAREIRDDSESNAAFRNALWPGEWGYVRDLEAEEQSFAACLDHNCADRRLYAVDCYRPDYASRVVILKVTSEAAAPQGVAGELRKEEQKQCEKMNATATRQVGVQLSLPVPIGQPQTLTMKGQTCEILRFKGKGPNLTQTIAIAKSMQGKQMLTLKEARAITGDIESNAAFRNALRPGEWGYVRDAVAEALSFAACLYYNGHYGRLYTYDLNRPASTSRVMILKVISEVAAPQAQAELQASVPVREEK